MSAQRWKNQERVVAAKLGGKRLPNNGVGQPDVRLPGWALQVKTKKELPSWFTDAIDQSTRDARADEHPAVVFCEVTQGIATRRFVAMEFDQFVQLIADVAKIGEEG